MEAFKIEPAITHDLFCAPMYRTGEYKEIEGGNPFLVEYKGERLYIYIKNLSPAQLSNNNPDIWRVQLPIKKGFESIAKSEYKFILLGYDVTNDIFATWNPYMVKQRLNVANSVSLYSRWTMQVKAHRKDDFQRVPLNNDGEVLLFPRKKIAEYLNDIDKFFADKSKYVALGSRKRVDANDTYRYFCDAKNMYKFYESMVEEGFGSSKNYYRYLKKVFESALISKYRKHFLMYEDINDYLKAVNQFIEEPEINEINRAEHNFYSATLKKYILFLINNSFKTTSSKQEKAYKIEEENGLFASEYDEPERYVERNVNESGKLTKLANPELLAKIKPYLEGDYKDTQKALQTVRAFYENTFPTMTFVDWMRLIQEVSFDKENIVESHEHLSSGEKKILYIVFGNGKVIKHRNVVKTMIDFVKEVGPELVRSANVRTNGANLVSNISEIVPKYHKSSKPVGYGLYVQTCSNIGQKYRYLKKVIDKLSLDAKIEIVVDKN